VKAAGIISQFVFENAYQTQILQPGLVLVCRCSLLEVSEVFSRKFRKEVLPEEIFSYLERR
jgi:hypothetical protein